MNGRISAMDDGGRVLVHITGTPVSTSAFLTYEEADALIECIDAVRPKPDYVADAKLPSPMLVDA